MSTTTVKRVSTKDLQKAQEHMRIFAQSKANLAELQRRIANEMEVYKNNMKNAEEALLEFGQKHRAAFDDDGNFQLEDGYIHAASNTVIVTSKKFDLAEFSQQFPNMVDVKLKVAPIKKAILNQDQAKQLKALGVSTDTDEVLQVIANNPEA